MLLLLRQCCTFFLLTITVFWTLNGFASHHGVDFSGIPVSQSLSDAKKYFPARLQRVLAFYKDIPNELHALQNDGDYAKLTKYAIAAILRHDEQWPQAQSFVNAIILHPDTKVFAPYGSSFHDLKPICERDGDYDFSANMLLTLLLADQKFAKENGENLLSRASRKKIVFELLPLSLPQPYDTIELGLCGKHAETENHILMTNTAMYLSNQLRNHMGDYQDKYDNDASGYSQWLTDYLRHIATHFFEEYHAKPYQGYAISAVHLLHSMSDNSEVRQAAQEVLNVTNGLFALSSNHLRRFPAFRRKAQNKDVTTGWHDDAEIARAALYVGNYHYLIDPNKQSLKETPFGERFMLTSAVFSYDMPDIMVDLLLQKQKPYFQMMKHSNLEIIAATPSYTLSAGGHFDYHFKYGSDEQHGWARPTMLIPMNEPSSDYHDFIHFQGTKQRKLRHNICVSHGFACGLNLQIPEKINKLPTHCKVQHANRTFYDLSKPSCLGYGFYVMVAVEECSQMNCALYADNYGYIEVATADKSSFQQFIENISKRNPATLSFWSTQRYTRSTGAEISFDLSVLNFEQSIISHDALNPLFSLSHNINDWPYVFGDVIQQVGNELTFINPNNHDKLKIS